MHIAGKSSCLLLTTRICTIKLTMRFISFCLLILCVVGSNFVFAQKGLRSGVYRALLARPDGRDVVFNFQVKDSAGAKVLYVSNAGERLLVDSIRVQGDSVWIQMPFFDSYFKAAIQPNGNLQGVWNKRFADREQTMPFTALFNAKQRFVAAAKPKYNITGRWDVRFGADSTTAEKAVGEFVQRGSLLTGTFLTPTGDYRYLEGIVSGDSLLLSGFDGGHAFQFAARIANNSTLSEGRFYNGTAKASPWQGRKDPKVELPSGYDETRLRDGESRLNFRFLSTDSQWVSINDERYKNKVVVVQILGSWCPNCMDETGFLSEYYKQNKDRGFEVIGLAYERTTDFERSKLALERFRKRFGVTYPFLVTGATVSDPQRSEKTLPQLAGIKAFPTSIFIDKKGIVRKIHSGFSGPGTGVHYEKFREEFGATINALLSE